jgi:hypothetical protein
MLHSSNVEYLLKLLRVFKEARIQNSIALITKASVNDNIMTAIRAIEDLRIIFCLSYSGLGQHLEPNFTHESLRSNFEIVKKFGFPILHFWRPLLPENTTAEAIEKMLSFVSKIADASVFVGFKLHPELTKIVMQDGSILVPRELQKDVGEWLESEAIDRIYALAKRICPNYPLYRHTSCALATIMDCPNHTGTIYRVDICPPSQCPKAQRAICERGRKIPSREQIVQTLARIGRPLAFQCDEQGVRIENRVTQEEYSYIVQTLSCPVTAQSVQMQNLYFGSIHEGRWAPPIRASNLETVAGRIDQTPSDG